MIWLQFCYTITVYLLFCDIHYLWELKPKCLFHLIWFLGKNVRWWPWVWSRNKFLRTTYAILSEGNENTFQLLNKVVMFAPDTITDTTKTSITMTINPRRHFMNAQKFVAIKVVAWQFIYYVFKITDLTRIYFLALSPPFLSMFICSNFLFKDRSRWLRLIAFGFLLGTPDPG